MAVISTNMFMFFSNMRFKITVHYIYGYANVVASFVVNKIPIWVPVLLLSHCTVGQLSMAGLVFKEIERDTMYEQIPSMNTCCLI